MSTARPLDFQLERNLHGRLVLIDAAGQPHVGIVPVRAFPIAAPAEGLSLVSADGHELAWIDQLADLPAPMRALLEAELALREFTPRISRLIGVSTFATPSQWDVETDRGPTSFVLKVEEDIRRLANGDLLIASASGIHYLVPAWRSLDRHTRRLLERFL